MDTSATLINERESGGAFRMEFSGMEPLLARRSRRGSRDHRLVLIILWIWVVHIFDLGFTVLAHELGVLNELNPIGRRLLLVGPRALVLYKAVLLLAGSLVFWRFRDVLLAEQAAWAYAILCVGLCLWWSLLYMHAEPEWVEAALSSRVLPPGQYSLPLVTPPAS